MTLTMRVVAVVLFFWVALPGGRTAQAQSPASQASQMPAGRAEAYYHFSMGHLYAELATVYGNSGDYLSKAIAHYRQALKADPDASQVAEELTEAYIQAGRLNDAVTEAEERLRQNPEAVEPRRILGRIYSRLIGDQRTNKINQEMLRKAIGQYEKIAAKDAKDIETWLMLGRLHKIDQNSVESEKAYKKALETDPNSDEALMGLAMVYSDVGDSRRAIEMLRRAADRNPNPRTLAALADAHEQMRDYAGAAAVLRKSLELAPNDLNLKKALAQNLAFSNQLDEALKLYLEIAEADPRDLQTRLRLSQIYRQQRNFEKARAALDRAKELDPDNVEVRYNEVNLLEAEGKGAEAIQLMKDLVDSSAKKSYSASERGGRLVMLERLGLLYRSNLRFKEAVETFRKMAELDPEVGPRASAQVIDTLRQAKDVTQAIAEADAARKNYPNDRMIGLIRASLLADLGKGEQAVAEMKKLLDGKDDRNTYLALAQVYEKVKNYAEMGKALDEAGKLSQTKDEKEAVLFMRGAMFERSKNFEEAEATFRKVIDLNPENASALNYLGYMLADRNIRLDEAYQLVSKAVELEPNNGAYLDSLGWVYFRKGNLDEAEAYLRRALERVPRDPTVNDHLGDVLAKKGKLKEAVAQWEISLKEWSASPPSELDPSEVSKVGKKLEGARVRLAQESSKAVRKQ